MAKFRKKPIVVEAEQWFPGKHVDGVIQGTADDVGIYYGLIHTLEGPHVVSEGDWIITGIANEKYPCKDAIFRATYESVEEEYPKSHMEWLEMQQERERGK